MAKVSIATKPLVYSTFRYIANTAWNALAEYVDNSLQSFIAHKEKLSQINEGGKLRVDIHIDDNEITITDNAWGILSQQDCHRSGRRYCARIPLLPLRLYTYLRHSQC